MPEDSESRRRVGASFTGVRRALAFAAARPGRDVPLAVLSAEARVSAFHLHRVFSSITGETPKQYMLRLRVSRGAALLLATDASVLDVALSCGFGSHEAFTRAFGRRFGMAPRAYRARGLAAGADRAAAAVHATAVGRIAPCIGLFHMRADAHARRTDMSYTILKKDLVPQPVLVVRRRVKRSDIGAAIGTALPHIFQYAQQQGIALAGHPFTRYLEIGAGLLTIEPGMRVVGGGHAPAGAGASAQVQPSSETTVVEDTLPGGPAATTVHAGPYETLPDAYAALEAWMESNGHPPSGAPWESYITDPAEHPDPKDWKTEICWPVR